ncbi:hypothetical protein AX774_g6676 [Zancudomyces culisetae]|uniref:Uncharacterized protein n=1 Tax=Zancudomyces culisetae TaxID=1213189 RepID=A0A1R1PG09_ZANCU|nr:hypothetical protein AX774_g6676 [Zancudomyces culisetae]|eukprot:OMH79896.1 hypothetical protein AX774_g6676 [Zancudomyces culisetae]
MPKVLINKEHTNVLIKEVVAKKRFELGTQNTCIKARPYSTVPKSQSHEYYQSHVRLQEETQILKDACDEPPKNVPFMSKNKSSHGRLDRDLETIKRYIYSGSSMNNGEFGQDRGITTEKHTAGDMHTKRTITGELPIEIHREELELGYHNLVYLLDPKLRKKNNKTNLTNSKDGDKSDNIIKLLKQLGDVNNDLETAVSVLESA